MKEKTAHIILACVTVTMILIPGGIMLLLGENNVTRNEVMAFFKYYVTSILILNIIIGIMINRLYKKRGK